MPIMSVIKTRIAEVLYSGPKRFGGSILHTDNMRLYGLFLGIIGGSLFEAYGLAVFQALKA